MKPYKNYYNLLDLPNTATEAEVRFAFRSKIVQSHHDKTPGNVSDLCYELIEAYGVLSNPQLRKKYDIEFSKNRNLTDPELVARYKSSLPHGLQTRLEVTPDLISELRHSYNLELAQMHHSQKGPPPKAICYDIKNFLSTKFKKDIETWKKSSHVNKIQDNFFSTYKTILEEIQVKNFPKKSQPIESYWCDLCEQNYDSEQDHCNCVIKPYVAYLGLSNRQQNRNFSEVKTSVLQFYSDVIGEWFDFEPTSSVHRKIWDRDSFANISLIVKEFVLELPDPDHFSDADAHACYIKKCTWVDPLISFYTGWVVLYSDTETLSRKAYELWNSTMATGDFSEILTYVAVLKEFLGFDSYDYRDFKDSAVKVSKFDEVLVWLLILAQDGDCSEEDFDFINSEIFQNLSRFLQRAWCRLAINSGFAEVDTVCEILINLEDFSEAISIYLEHYEISKLFSKHLELSSKPHNGAGDVFKKVYYSQQIKSLLKQLQDENDDEMLEQLLEISALILEDPSNFYRLLMEGLPDKLCLPVFYAIHFYTIEKLASSVITQESLQLILAGWHFLAGENEVDYQFLKEQSVRIVGANLKKGLNTYDFEALTDALRTLNLRNVSAAEEILEEFSKESDQHASYLNSMLLMISGCVQKVHRNWIPAVTHFQDALLNTPEFNYRVSPCISKLTQDPELGRGVLEEVCLKIEELKTHCESRIFIEFPLETANSLVISHPSPEISLKYGHLAGKIQTQEPPPPGIEPPLDSSQLEAFTSTSNITLEKYERAIETGQEGKPLKASDAAYAYLDLLETLPSDMHPGPVVMAASHFLRAIDSASELSEAVAYQKAIAALAQMLLQLDSTNQARVQSCLTHKHIFSILLKANQQLSKWRQELETTLAQNDDEDARWVRSENYTEFKLISSADHTVISKLLQSIVGFSKVEPLLNIPCLTSSDLGYVEKIKTQFLHQFCIEKVKTQQNSPDSNNSIEQAYTLFLEVLHGRISSVQFDSVKETLMEAILHENRANKSQVTRNIEWPLGFHDNGWISNVSELNFCAQFQTFEAIEGFKLNFVTGQLSLLLKKPGRPIFSSQDIFEVCQNRLMFSKLQVGTLADLEPSPFHLITFDPPQLAGTDVLKTLLRVSSLVTTLATGMEMNQNPPFESREVEIAFVNGLPTHLQHFLRPLRERSQKLSTSETGESYSFSLSFPQVYFEQEEDDEEIRFLMGDLDLELSCACAAAASLDTNHNEEFSAARSFIQDFNSNSSELSEYFPELKRLQELSKISIIYSKLEEILKEGRFKDGVFNGIRTLCGNSETEFEFEDFDNELNFIPNPNCHTNYKGNEVSTSVFLQPAIVYGPVSISRQSLYCSVEDLLVMEDTSEIYNDKYKEDEIMFEVSTTATVYLKKEFADQEDNGIDENDYPMGFLDVGYLNTGNIQKQSGDIVPLQCFRKVSVNHPNVKLDNIGQDVKKLEQLEKEERNVNSLHEEEEDQSSISESLEHEEEDKSSIPETDVPEEVHENSISETAEEQENESSIPETDDGEEEEENSILETFEAEEVDTSIPKTDDEEEAKNSISETDEEDESSIPETDEGEGDESSIPETDEEEEEDKNSISETAEKEEDESSITETGEEEEGAASIPETKIEHCGSENTFKESEENEKRNANHEEDHEAVNIVSENELEEEEENHFSKDKQVKEHVEGTATVEGTDKDSAPQEHEAKEKCVKECNEEQVVTTGETELEDESGGSDLQEEEEENVEKEESEENESEPSNSSGDESDEEDDEPEITLKRKQNIKYSIQHRPSSLDTIDENPSENSAVHPNAYQDLYEFGPLVENAEPEETWEHNVSVEAGESFETENCTKASGALNSGGDLDNRRNSQHEIKLLKCDTLQSERSTASEEASCSEVEYGDKSGSGGIPLGIKTFPDIVTFKNDKIQDKKLDRKSPASEDKCMREDTVPIGAAKLSYAEVTFGKNNSIA